MFQKLFPILPLTGSSRLRDKLETYMDPVTLQSYEFKHCDVYEGGYTFYRSYDWDRKTNTIISFEDRKMERPRRKPLPVWIRVPLTLSVFYWARTIDFEKYKVGR